MLDQRRQLLRAAVGVAMLSTPSYNRAPLGTAYLARLVGGIGQVAVGVNTRLSWCWREHCSLYRVETDREYQRQSIIINLTR